MTAFATVMLEQYEAELLGHLAAVRHVARYLLLTERDRHPTRIALWRHHLRRAAEEAALAVGGWLIIGVAWEEVLTRRVDLELAEAVLRFSETARQHGHDCEVYRSAMKTLRRKAKTRGR